MGNHGLFFALSLADTLCYRARMAEAPASTPPTSAVFAGFKGLANTVTPERLGGDDLERARNVDLDDAGQVRRRRGYTLVSAGAYHSLFTVADGTVLGVKDGALGIVRPDYTHEVIAPGIGSEPLAYTQVGEDVFYSSRTASGIVHGDWSTSAWGASTSAGEWLSPVIAPTDTLGAVAGKVLGPPPMAHALTYFNGRIYLASKRTVWATELYLYRYVDKTRTYMQFEDDVTVMGTVADGIYVGTASSLWFLSGPSFAEMRRLKVYSAGCLSNSMVVSGAYPQEGGRVGTRTSLLVMTTEGLCRCQDSGTVYNLTEDRVWFPEATHAAAMYREQDGINQYVGVLNSAGDPMSTARLGDYVDAEIRRF